MGVLAPPFFTLSSTKSGDPEATRVLAPPFFTLRGEESGGSTSYVGSYSWAWTI